MLRQNFGTILDRGNRRPKIIIIINHMFDFGRSFNLESWLVYPTRLLRNLTLTIEMWVNLAGTDSRARLFSTLLLVCHQVFLYGCIKFIDLLIQNDLISTDNLPQRRRLPHRTIHIGRCLGRTHRNDHGFVNFDLLGLYRNLTGLSNTFSLRRRALWLKIRPTGCVFDGLNIRAFAIWVYFFQELALLIIPGRFEICDLFFLQALISFVQILLR